MSVGPHVFGDDRLGLWFMENESFPDKLRHRLPLVKGFCNGAITDIYLPESATRADRDRVRAEGFFSNVWTTPNSRGALTYAADSLAALSRISGGALELNIEVSDLVPYTRQVVASIRKVKPNLRLRINVPPLKGGLLKAMADVFVADPHLYVIAQVYYGNMDGRASEADVLLDLLDAGIPAAKCSVMYGACSEDPLTAAAGRVASLPAMTVRRLRRGSIYSDDLMVDAGLL